MRKSLALIPVAGLTATPAMAATGPFFSLGNTDFVVLLAFILFIAVLAYFKVPGLIGGLLDKRSDGIKAELDEARALRDEATALLAAYERKQKEVQGQADKIVEGARTEAAHAAEQAKKDLDAAIARRMAAASEQIASAEKAAIQEVRDRAVVVAVAAAKDVIAKQMTPAQSEALIESSITDVKSRLN